MLLKTYLHSKIIEAGCDEAGRGCLAGPVFAAAVIWPKDLELEELDDSKKLSELKRDKLRVQIEEKALAWSVAQCSISIIDDINILNASFLAMHKAVQELGMRPEHLLIDGNRFNHLDGYQYTTVIKGDGKYASIAAASILAKTHRDEYMKELDKQFPDFGFAKHKGYATAQHINAIKKFGYTDVHRKSFTLKKLQLKLL